LSSEYTQNVTYSLLLDFSPGSATVTAFGDTLTLSGDATPLTVMSVEVRIDQQDAYFDNVVFHQG